MPPITIEVPYMTSHGKPRLMEELIRSRAVCAASDQSLDFLAHLSICRKHFSGYLYTLKTIYEYRYMEKVDLGKRCLLLHQPDFPKSCHISKQLGLNATLNNPVSLPEPSCLTLGLHYQQF